MSEKSLAELQIENETLRRNYEDLKHRVGQRTAELVAAEERWRSLVTTAPDYIMILNRDGTIRYINHTFEGLAQKDVHGSSCYNFIDPAFHSAMRGYIEYVYQSGEFGKGEIVGDGPDKLPACYSLRLGPFREKGRIVGVTVIANDITEQKQTEQALLEETDFISHIVTSAPTIICGITPEGITNSVNNAITNVTGYAPEEVIDKNWWDLFYPGENRCQVDKLYEDFEKSSGTVTNYDMVLTAKDGSRRTVSWNSVNRFDADGNLLEIIGIGSDITDRYLAEEKILSEQWLLRRLLDIQEHERQTVSHEIHDGFLQYAITAKMTLEGLAHQMATSGREVPEGCNQIKELLGKAIDEGRRMIGELRPMIIDEKGILEAIHYLVAEETDIEAIDITFQHQVQFDRLDPMLEGAMFRITQEALTNIRRHSKSAKAEIRLTQNNGNLHLEIRDQGIGFDPDRVPSDHFGLRGIVERARLFGGTATIDSAPGKGTRITVRLPITLGDRSSGGVVGA